jgi:hypothetical protein
LFVMDIFSKSTQIPKFMKILPVTAELFHTERQTEMTKLAVHFRKCRTHLKRYKLK